MKDRYKGKRWFIIGLIASLLIPVLAACTKDDSQSNGSNKTPRTLRFASGFGYLGENGEAFRLYTEMFEFANDHIKLEYVETVDQNNFGGIYIPPEDEEPVDTLQALKEAMTGPIPPDIVMIDYGQLAELINENLLVSLDELIRNEKEYNIDDIVPAVIDGLRKPGNGTLYALAPLFSSSAVIYNKKFFLDKGVPFPTDGMTWQDMFELARRVTVKDKDNPVYGFSFNTYYGGGIWDNFHNIGTYTAPLGMKWIDADTLTMTANTKEWQEVWKLFTDLYKEGVFPQEPDWNKPREGPVAWDMFLSGEIAMAIVSSNYLTDVISANNNADRIEGFEPIDWDVVTVPTHPEAPGIGTNISYDAVFAINAKAENLEDAWEFIKFVTGEDWARIKSKSVYGMLARKSYIQKKEGADYNLDAFLQLSPPEDSAYDLQLSQKLPNYWELMNIGQQKMYDVIQNGKDIELALREWDTEGQAAIQAMMEAKQNESENGSL